MALTAEDRSALSSPGARPGSRSDLFGEAAAALLEERQTILFRAEGGSMRPAIRHGERVRVEPLPPSGPRRGDVLLCRSEGGLLLHRLVGADGGSECLLRGDALLACDPPLSWSAVMGRATAVERGGRWLPLTGWVGSGVARLRHAGFRFRALSSRLARLLVGRPPGDRGDG